MWSLRQTLLKHTHTHATTHTLTHTRILPYALSFPCVLHSLEAVSLSLSLSLTHTHTHTHSVSLILTLTYLDGHYILRLLSMSLRECESVCKCVREKEREKEIEKEKIERERKGDREREIATRRSVGASGCYILCFRVTEQKKRGKARPTYECVLRSLKGKWLCWKLLHWTDHYILCRIKLFGAAKEGSGQWNSASMKRTKKLFSRPPICPTRIWQRTWPIIEMQWIIKITEKAINKLSLTGGLKFGKKTTSRQNKKIAIKIAENLSFNYKGVKHQCLVCQWRCVPFLNTFPWKNSFEQVPARWAMVVSSYGLKDPSSKLHCEPNYFNVGKTQVMITPRHYPHYGLGFDLV